MHASKPIQIKPLNTEFSPTSEHYKIRTPPIAPELHKSLKGAASNWFKGITSKVRAVIKYDVDTPKRGGDIVEFYIFGTALHEQVTDVARQLGEYIGKEVSVHLTPSKTMGVIEDAYIAAGNELCLFVRQKSPSSEVALFDFALDADAKNPKRLDAIYHCVDFDKDPGCYQFVYHHAGKEDKYAYYFEVKDPSVLAPIQRQQGDSG